MLTYKMELSNMKIYTSDIIDDKLFYFSKHCQFCGAEVDIHNNNDICWMSLDRKHHPSFVLIGNVSHDG